MNPDNHFPAEPRTSPASISVATARFQALEQMARSVNNDRTHRPSRRLMAGLRRLSRVR